MGKRGLYQGPELCRASGRDPESREDFIGAGWPDHTHQRSADDDNDPMERHSITTIAGSPAPAARPAPPPGRSDSAADLRSMAGGAGPLRRTLSSISVADSALEYGVDEDDADSLRRLSGGALVTPSGVSITDSALGYGGGGGRDAVAAMRTASVADSALEFGGRLAAPRRFVGGALAAVRSDSLADSVYDGADDAPDYAGGTDAQLHRFSAGASGPGSLTDSANEVPAAARQTISERSDSVESWPRTRSSRHASPEPRRSGLLGDRSRSRSALLDSAGESWLDEFWSVLLRAVTMGYLCFLIGY